MQANLQPILSQILLPWQEGLLGRRYKWHCWIGRLRLPYPRTKPEVDRIMGWWEI